MAVAGADGFDEFGDGLALVALGGVFGVEAEGGHGGLGGESELRLRLQAGP